MAELKLTLPHRIPAADLGDAFDALLAADALANYVRVVDRQRTTTALRARLAGDHLRDGIVTLTHTELIIRLDLTSLASLASGRIERELTTLLRERLRRLSPPEHP